MPTQNVGVCWILAEFSIGWFITTSSLGPRSFSGMEAAGCSPNTRTFVAVIKACANLAVRDNGKKAAMLLKGRDLHLQAEKLGFGRDAFVAASLVNFYAKCGRMEQAREVFDRIKQPDVVSWNALILGYAANGQGEVAYELFQRFLRRHRDGYSSIAPDGVTFAAALNACGGMAAKEQAKLGTGKLLKTLDKVMALHVQAEKSLSCDKFPKSIVNSLMDLYARCGSLEDARRAFDRMSCHSHSNWTSLISIYADYDEPELAFELFEHLQAHDELINARAFLAGLKAVTALVEREQSVRQADGKHLKLVSLKTALEIHYRAISHGCDCDSYVACSLVTLYAKCGSLVEATKVFEEMAEPPDAALWNAVILGCAENEQGDLALEYFARMQATASCKPDAITFCAALEACSVLAGKEAGTQVEGDKVAKLVSLERGMEVHSRIVKDGRGELEQDVVLSSALISMYSKCGSLVDAVRVFERIERHDVVSWTALVLGCVENGEAGLSLRYFWPMLLERDSSSFKPDSRAVVAALKACCALADEERSSLKLDETSSKLMVESLEQGMAVHSEAAKHGFELDMVVANTLVEFYSKCGSMLDARAAFDKMPQRNSSSWTSLLLGYVECGQPEVALELFELARASRRDLFDAPGFVAALKACGVLVSLQSAKDIHAEIYRRPDLLEENELLVTTLVDVYGKCGSMVDAEHIFDYVVAARDDPVIWSALISGYSRQGNTQQVLGVFRKMEGEFVRVSSSSLLCFLTACSHAGLVEKGARCFERMASKYGVSPSLEHYSAMVDLYGRAGKLEAALSLVESVALEANAGIWRSILGACWKWKNSVVARVAYKRLLDMNEADAGAHVTMANLCSLEH
ncbi:pentatricopeptide repeat-containing protein At3g03580-like [Selaginella moellendorffii]|uniref:pentatricopeptide repeat-containing protein At3g03580-like n=1 Tax=Selaginella moellendorffii TaxID=88036 RepID=UPI000D1C5002|nr:pentatricopeptide repeat-containing protein At3g03580-like [Selaginella moellendorffii]|eukprot:XP_024519743.1 pentatricopeptide repeat-containing protein At3g03580-like [Selaginella moellendorffii]